MNSLLRSFYSFKLFKKYYIFTVLNCEQHYVVSYDTTVAMAMFKHDTVTLYSSE